MTRLKIKADEWYTLQDIVKKKMFIFPAQPWKNAGSFWSVRNLVEADQKGKNILSANVVGTGRGKKYHFKGANILKFINSVEKVK